MHGFSSGSTLLVNAEVDSMGEVIDSGVGTATKTSPCQAAVEKARADLRLEYDVREERRRELEFLEKGGNPLDFRIGLAASVSVQSTSLTDQLHGQYVTSEAKGSFALATSPQGDSVESSGRLGAAVACEPNSADNFDGENELIENDRKSTYPSRSNITPSEQSSQPDRIQNVRQSEDSPISHPKKAYRRRNRTKTNRDTAHSSSIDVASRGGPSSSLPSRHAVVSNSVMLESPSDTEMDVAITMNPTTGCLSEGKLDVAVSEHLHDDMDNQHIQGNGIPSAITPGKPDSIMGREQTLPVVGECPPCSVSEKPVDAVPEQLSEPNQLQGDGKCLETEDVANKVAVISKGLDSESSCTQASVSVEGNGNIDSDLCTSLKNVYSIGERNEQKVPIKQTAKSEDEVTLEDRKAAYAAEKNSCFNDNHIPQNCPANSFPGKDEEAANTNEFSAQNEAKSNPNFEQMQPNQHTNTITDMKQGSSDAHIPEAESCCPEKPHIPQDPSVYELNKTDICGSVLALENQTKVVDKAHEDRILEEAQIIEVKRKRIKELSIGPLLKEYRRKSHWDYVLEEMAWMANDFAQECLWKRTAAAQLCHRASFASRLKLEEMCKHMEEKVVAQTLARAVMEFWHSTGLSLGETGIVSGSEACEHGKVASENVDDNCNANSTNGSHDKESQEKNIKTSVQRYALRFMQHNSSVVRLVDAEASRTPERASVIDMPEMTSVNEYAEEDLFFVVPHGAMEAYRKSIEKASTNMQEDVDTSVNDALEEFESQENEYEEDEGESTYYLPGAFEGCKPSKFVQKKRKNPKSCTPKSYELGSDFSYGLCPENRNTTPQSAVLGRRPPNGLNVGSIPTKRIRTASRQRVVGPYSSGGSGIIPVPSRTDASSGDTGSFHDEQSTLHGGSLIHRGLEVDSGMKFDKQSTFDSAEIAAQPKKKKKTKYRGARYDQRWQVDANMHSEQKAHLRKRMESHQFESHGNGGLFGPHAKKAKTMKQSLDNSFENATLMSGSVASPVGSQMSNMSKPNKLIKLISVRDCGRKAKALKMPSGHTGSGSPWSLFEDQALVVLVHDMGPNWELVSDAINSTLRFKCIFRNPKECKERHKILIEKSCGDGADSAEDSGSSQPYPSTLRGIPKGGASQLFQQLRGPIEEDTIKSHFERIILLGQQLHGIKKQEPKQLVPVHGSHLAAFSQVIPNNLNGGVLTPLDLCDMTAPSADVFSLSYQGHHSSALPLGNQGTAQSTLPSSGTNSSLQGSPAMGLGCNLASPSAQHSGPVRDGRYVDPRTSLQIDEQQRVKQYNHILSGRNIQQTNMAVPGAFSGNDRGVLNRSMPVPGGNGMVMPGMNRNMSMPRPGLQGVSSPSMLNSGSVVASNTVAMPSSMNMHSGTSPGQRNSMLQPRAASHMVRPGQNPEHQMQMMSSEMQLQATQANGQGVTSFGGLSSTFPNQSASPSVPSYPVHHHQQRISQQQSNMLSNSHHPHLQGSAHPASAEQQAFAMSLARDRQLRQRVLQRQQQQQQQQQHQQFPASSALMSHAPAQPHLPISTAMQNSSKIQSQSSSQPLSLPPPTTSSSVTPVSSQQQPKHQLQHHGLGRTPQTGAGGMMNQVGKQRQYQNQQLPQQFQLSGRHHLPQRQLSQSQQQAKLLKGMGKGNILMHQNLHVDSSNMNGLSDNPGEQMEKGEQAMHLLQGQGHATRSSKSLVPPSSSQSLKLVHQIPSHPDGTNLTQLPAVTSACLVPTSNQSLPLPGVPSFNHRQLKVRPSPPVRLVNHSQPTLQSAVSENCVMNSDLLSEEQNDQSQADQQLANNPTPVSPTPVNTASRIPSKSTNAVSDATCAGSAHWQTSDPMSDLVIPISSNQLGPTVSSSMSKSSGSEPVGSGGQGLGQRQPSGGLLSHSHVVGTQWQQQQQLQQPP